MSEGDRATEPDRVVHEPARLKIMTILFVTQEADFTYLLRESGLTRGNLSAQLSRLEEAGYVSIEKAFVDRVPRTTASLTAGGRKAFKQYRGFLEGLLKATE